MFHPVEGFACGLVAAADITTSGKRSRELVEFLHPDVVWWGDEAYDSDPYRALLNTQKIQKLLAWRPVYTWQKFISQRNKMKKTKIRALILDYGGVISQPQNPDNVKNMLQILKQDDHDFRNVYQGERANYDKGQLSGEDYWRNIYRHYDLEPNDTGIAKLIQEDVKSWTHINDSMVRFIKENRGRLHKLAIISNMTRNTLAFMNTHFQWLEYFDELIYSCDVGTNKPDARIYEACLNRLEILPQECLFVDDSEENVLGAMKLDMKVIHFKSFSQFWQELDENFYLTNYG